MSTDTTAGIVSRLFDPKIGTWAPEAAEAILRLNFHETDHVRMDELLSKAQAGHLTDAEREELQEYLQVADMLAVFQVKARQSLRPTPQAH